MGSSAARHGRFVVRAGVILLLISLVNGFLVQALPLERLALSAHLLGLIGSSLLIGLGLLWPKLNQTCRSSRIGAYLAVYGFCGGWLIYFSAAATGAGGMFPMASAGARGNAIVEGLISAGMVTIALALFALCGIVLWGLREGHDSG
jgi:hypothetical protein